jgi:hypothetical protein
MSTVYTNSPADKEPLPDAVVARLFEELEANDTFFKDVALENLTFKNFASKTGRRTPNGTWVRVRGGKEAIIRIYGEVADTQLGNYGDAPKSNDPVSKLFNKWEMILSRNRFLRIVLKG